MRASCAAPGCAVLYPKPPLLEGYECCGCACGPACQFVLACSQAVCNRYTVFDPPLYDSLARTHARAVTGRLTTPCVKALLRIFLMCDLDQVRS